MKKVLQIVVIISMVLLSLLSICFSAYGLFQSTNVYGVIKMQQGYQQCVVDVNKELAAKQQANQQTTNEK